MKALLLPLRWWLAAGIVLTTATQLRAAAVPLGPGELLLVGWVAVIASALVFAGRVRPSPLAGVVIGFWAVAYALMVAGWIVARHLGLEARMALHDAPAFLFLSVVTGTIVLRENALDEIRATGPWLVPFSVVPLVLILAAVATGRVMVGPFEAWVGRYQGWAINANAVALVMTPVPFVIFHQLGRTRGWPLRTAWVLLLLCALAVGVATLSDGLTVAWTLGIGTLLVLSWLNLVSRPRLPLGTAALAYVLVPLVTVLVVLLTGYQAWQFLQESAEGIYNKQEGQGSFRLRLWVYALVAIARSPLVGLGPGAHSGHLGPFGDGEAHNTFLDWGASTGLLGVSLYVALLAWVLVQAYRARTPTLLCAAMALASFSMFHYVLRHPVFWFYLMYVAAESQARLAAPPEGGREAGVVRGGSPGGVAGVPQGALT